jgi:hypothetical protein
MPKDLAQHPAATYHPGSALEAVDADAERRGLSPAAWLREIVLEVVQRTTAASGVPERLEDASTAEVVAQLLRGDLA